MFLRLLKWQSENRNENNSADFNAVLCVCRGAGFIRFTLAGSSMFFGVRVFPNARAEGVKELWLTASVLLRFLLDTDKVANAVSAPTGDFFAGKVLRLRLIFARAAFVALRLTSERYCDCALLPRSRY
jgi:hypothetical protein